MTSQRIIYLDTPTYITEGFIERMRGYADFQVFYDKPDLSTAAERLSAADIAIVEWTKLSAELFRRVRRLRFISLALTSYDIVDLEAAREAGILVSNCPGYSMHAVAEHAFALLLCCARRLLAADRLVREGRRHVYTPFLAPELHNLTLGLVGTGRIGRAIGRIANGFGMRVIGANRSGGTVDGVEIHTLAQVLAMSDVVSVQVPMNADTCGLLTRTLLESMKRGAYLVSVSREGVLDTEALADLLADGHLAGAGLDDVGEHSRLTTLDNVTLTPGSAWYTDQARERNLVEIEQNVAAFIGSQPINLVS